MRKPNGFYKVNPQSGFTLIELLIVITIIVTVTATVIPSFAGYIKSQGIKQAQEQLKSDLRSAQNKALTGSLSDTTVGGNQTLFWGVRFSPGGGSGTNRYEYFISDSDSSCPTDVLSNEQLQGYSELASGISVYTQNYKCVYFSMANGGISSINVSSDTLKIEYSGSTTNGDCRYMHFNANGLIYSGASVSCT